MSFARTPHLPACTGALQDPDVSVQVCWHDEDEFGPFLVLWMTTDLVPICHASITNSGGPCWQKQLPDGHASEWTEKPSEAFRATFEKATLRNDYVTDDRGCLSKKVHCRSSSSIHILYNHDPS